MALALRVWFRFGALYVGLRRHPLPEVIERLGSVPPKARRRVEPARLGLMVYKALGIGPWHPRCLYGALVLFRFLRRQGELAQLVIGLPREPRDKDAHAWVEIAGVDVGPPPGRARHEELARYG